MALRALDALADKTDGKRKAGELKKVAAEVEREVAIWLAVLAHCFELQDEFKVLEIDHVLATAPEKLEGHRRGVVEALETRRALVLDKTAALMARMDAAGGIVNECVLLHAKAARSVIDSLNSTATQIDQFHAPLGIDGGREALPLLRWREALRDPQQLKTAGLEAAQKAAVAGGTALAGVALVVGTRNASNSDS